MALALLMTLAACGQQSEGTSTRPDAKLIDCAIGGAAELTKVCALETSQTGEALLWTVRHPDGSFRRFSVKAGASRNIEADVVTADGADQAQVRLADRGIPCLYAEVDGDRYCLPVEYAKRP